MYSLFLIDLNYNVICVYDSYQNHCDGFEQHYCNLSNYHIVPPGPP